MVPPDNLGGGGIRGGRPPMRGSSKLRPRSASQAPPEVPKPSRTPAQSSRKQRVLFVCIGNSCRSQMAEAFARAYGGDILEVSSAGTSPAPIIAPLTRQVLAERNIGTEGQFPKGLEMVTRDTATNPYDIVVNLSGIPIRPIGHKHLDWLVQDPIGQKESVYRSVAAQLEAMVMRLILDLRKGGKV